MTLDTEFWARVAIPVDGGCWEWTGGRQPRGYGIAWWRGHHWRSHRLAWTLTHGSIPTGQMVCHHCDNPPCCNPAHLFLGTAATNYADAAKKDRSTRGTRHGSRTRGGPKLDRLQASAIRLFCQCGDSQRTIAKKFGISQSLVSLIANAKRWGADA